MLWIYSGRNLIKCFHKFLGEMDPSKALSEKYSFFPLIDINIVYTIKDSESLCVTQSHHVGRMTNSGKSC